MKFEQALQALREGKKVKRAQWRPENYILLMDGKIMVHFYRRTGEQFVNCDFGSEYILAEDWEIEETAFEVSDEILLKAIKEFKKNLLYPIKKNQLYTLSFCFEVSADKENNIQLEIYRPSLVAGVADDDKA